MEFIASNRGGKKLIYQGYVYVKQKNLAGRVEAYECEMRRNLKQCKAKIRIIGNDVVGMSNEHTHAPDTGRPEALRVREAIKHRAIETVETPQQIITQGIDNISDQAAVKLPAIRHIRRGVRRHRQLAGQPLPAPQNRDEIIIPNEFQNTSSGERFLLYDSGAGDQNRQLIFCTQRNMDILMNSTDWFCDGTFKVVPGLFYQLFTIHGLVNGNMVACVYALLPNKQQDTYTSLLRVLRNANPLLSPRTVMIDYELASMNAIQEIFPDAIVQGCLYHLSQAIYRKVQHHGLQVAYQNNCDLSLSIRMLAALAFVPVNDIVHAFEELSDIMPEDARPIVDYFEDTYIGRVQRRGRRLPLFPHAMWNVKERVDHGLPRTNNHLEGWHRHMASNVGAYHPNFWRFLKVLQREQALNEVTITQMLAGEPAPPQRRKYKAITQRLKTLVEDYDNRALIDYLRGIAHNLQL